MCVCVLIIDNSFAAIFTSRKTYLIVLCCMFFKILRFVISLYNTQCNIACYILYLYIVSQILDKFHRVQSQRRQKKGFIPVTLVRCYFFPVSPVLKRNVWKKASHITSSSISVFVIQIQREKFFWSRGKKTQKRGAPPKKVARSTHETDPSYLQSHPYL